MDRVSPLLIALARCIESAYENEIGGTVAPMPAIREVAPDDDSEVDREQEERIPRAA